MRTTLLTVSIVLLTTIQHVAAQSESQTPTDREPDRATKDSTATSQKLVHLKQAIEHLQAAGLNELVEPIREHMEQETRRELLLSKRSQLASILTRTAELQAEIRHLECSSLGSGEGQQILVNLRVLEISLTKLRDQGIKLGDSGLGSLLEKKSSIGTGAEEYLLGIVEQDTRFAKTLEALQEAGLVKTLAEPTLVTVSGRPASFRSGGAFPILIPQSSGEVSVEYREFGTRVDLVPRHLGKGRILLEIRPEISQIDPNQSVTVGDFQVPRLNIRMVDTSAELKNGQTLALAGIMRTVKSPPDAPSEETAVSDTAGASEEVELIVLATPTLVDEVPQRPVPVTAARSATPVDGRTGPNKKPIVSR